MKREKNVVNVSLVSLFYFEMAADGIENVRPKEFLRNEEFMATFPDEGQREDAKFYRVPFESVQGRLSVFGTPLEPHNGYCYGILGGNSRAFSAVLLAKDGVIDPATCKRDEAGDLLLGTGKVVSTLRGIVYSDCTVEELADLMKDNTQVRLPLKAINRMLIRAYDASGDADGTNKPSEYKAKFKVYGNLLQAYPPVGEDLVKYNAYVASLPASFTESQRAEAIRGYHIGGPEVKGAPSRQKEGRLHGKYLIIFHAYKGATLVKEAYEARVDGKQKWPADGEINTLYKLYNEDIDDDAKLPNPTYAITPDTPGPKFMEKWNTILAKVEEARQEALNGGSGRVTSTEPLAKQQIELIIKNALSRSTKMVLLRVLNKISALQFNDFQNAQLLFENRKIDRAEYDARLSLIMGAKPAAETVVTSGQPTSGEPKSEPDVMEGEVVNALPEPANA